MKNKLLNDKYYLGMTEHDAEKMENLNRKNNYGLSCVKLIKLIKQHKAARKRNDLRTMSKIEYRLTDINFHHECKYLNSGNYDELINECKSAMHYPRFFQH